MVTFCFVALMPGIDPGAKVGTLTLLLQVGSSGMDQKERIRRVGPGGGSGLVCWRTWSWVLESRSGWVGKLGSGG